MSVRNGYASQQRTLDLLAADLLPCCPGCGDLSGPGSVICESCGNALTLLNMPAVARKLVDA